MTENEAIEAIKEMERQSGEILNNPTMFYSEKNIAAGCDTMKRHIEAYKIAEKSMNEIQAYRALGTVEKLREAVEKQIPQKPNFDGDGYADGSSYRIYGYARNAGVNLRFIASTTTALAAASE